MAETVKRYFRIPVTLSERLRVEAERRIVGESLLVKKAIELYLDQLPPIDDVLP